MPPDLRPESPTWPSRHRTGLSQPPSSASGSRSSPPGTQRERSRSSAGTVTVGFSALLMMVMVVLLAWDRPNSPGENSGSRSPDNKHRHEGDSPALSRHAEQDRNDPRNPLHREGQDPVEMRRGIHHVGQGGPGGHDSKFPELDIEVFPLDREPAPGKNKKSPKPELPKSKRPKSELPPMPEENRHLPENRPPHSADPDEAALEPVLPELETPPALPLS